MEQKPLWVKSGKHSEKPHSRKRGILKWAQAYPFRL